MTKIAILLLAIISIAVLLFTNHKYEGFRAGSKCPSSLIQSGDKLMLIYNNEPIYFDDLDEYVMFVKKLRSEGIDCPVSVLEDGVIDNNKQQEVLDATRDSNKYNTDMYPGFDPYGLHIGHYTKIDAVHDSTANYKISDNPMDPNWGGVEHTQDMVASGKYEENEVTKQSYFNPKVQFFPDIKHDPNLFKGSRQ